MIPCAVTGPGAVKAKEKDIRGIECLFFVSIGTAAKPDQKIRRAIELKFFAI